MIKTLKLTKEEQKALRSTAMCAIIVIFVYLAGYSLFDPSISALAPTIIIISCLILHIHTLLNDLEYLNSQEKFFKNFEKKWIEIKKGNDPIGMLKDQIKAVPIPKDHYLYRALITIESLAGEQHSDLANQITLMGMPKNIGQSRANLLMLLGLLGTVVGLSIVVQSLRVTDEAMLLQSIQNTLKEMGTAFLSTGWGIISACISVFLCQNIRKKSDILIYSIDSLLFTDLISPIVRNKQKDLSKPEVLHRVGEEIQNNIKLFSESLTVQNAALETHLKSLKQSVDELHQLLSSSSNGVRTLAQSVDRTTSSTGTLLTSTSSEIKRSVTEMSKIQKENESLKKDLTEKAAEIEVIRRKYLAMESIVNNINTKPAYTPQINPQYPPRQPQKPLEFTVDKIEESDSKTKTNIIGKIVNFFKR